MVNMISADRICIISFKPISENLTFKSINNLSAKPVRIEKHQLSYNIHNQLIILILISNNLLYCVQ